MKQTKQKRVIKAWAIINGASGFIYHHDFRKMLSIYADEEEANHFISPDEDEQVVEVIITFPSPKQTKKKRA